MGNTHNRFTAVEDAVTWFQDAEAGNFQPASDSPLRQQADAAWLPPDDFFGDARESLDIGAVAYPP